MAKYRGGGMPNMNNMMKQVQKMQKQMEETQKKLEESIVTTTAGGGAIEIVINGKKEIQSVTIDPDILIVSEPTRGIDIGAKKLVLEYLVKLNRERGITIIMVSSELVELRSLCDRIAIVSDGKLAKILKPDASDAEYGLAMAGSRKESGGNE